MPDDSRLYKDLLEKGYQLSQAGSIAHEDGFIYSAYIFYRWEGADLLPKDTYVIAFYRWDGEENILLGSHYPSPYSDGIQSYPRQAFLANWDDPFGSMIGLGRIENPDNETREKRGLNGFASDINGNGRPEFTIGSEYCPISCSRPLYAYDFFEIEAGGKVTNLSRDMPGRLNLYPFSEEPLVFKVNDAYWHGFISQIHLPYYYQWDGTRFVEVTERYHSQILAEISEKIMAIQSHFSEPIGEQTTVDMISVLLFSEHIGMSSEGLDKFLEISNPTNWEDLPLEIRCWLQFTRARAQDEYQDQNKFSIPIALVNFAFYIEGYIPSQIEKLGADNYDLSACQAWIEGDDNQ